MSVRTERAKILIIYSSLSSRATARDLIVRLPQSPCRDIAEISYLKGAHEISPLRSSGRMPSSLRFRILFEFNINTRVQGESGATLARNDTILFYLRERGAAGAKGGQGRFICLVAKRACGISAHISPNQRAKAPRGEGILRGARRLYTAAFQSPKRRPKGAF